MEMETKKQVENEEIIKQDWFISKEQFFQYVNVQQTGLFNMLDPRARAYTNLNKEEWLYIIEHYSYLNNLYK
jgi:hypothetical protein